MAEKVGLQISFDKNKILVVPEKTTTKLGDIRRVQTFKYLGQVIQTNVIEQKGHNQRRPEHSERPETSRIRHAYHVTPKPDITTLSSYQKTFMNPVQKHWS